MTYEEFLVELEKTPRDWYLKYETYIRLGGTTYSMCPLSSLKGYDIVGWYDAAIELGLDEITAGKIVDAADSMDDHDPQIRADLLKACGLTSSQ